MLECQRRAREKYREKVKTIRFELFPSEADIREHLESKAENGEKIATYIKNLIREDMQKG